ncbi:hypothetical protein COCCU_06170 [Corynebacterium occultum]|uniref:Uncharacterized protein n=2 Tax=Corynebacterium occultum TaxID=2675219 RepID=A0A6B8WL87_9CORY|nr:hypothetical protein COCCU_06170 [Corynebacterium occultum]
MHNHGSDMKKWDVSPEEAKDILADISAINQAAEWKPSPGATALLALVFASLITAAVWELFFWMFGLLALLFLLLFLFRRQLINPYVRHRPWQPLGQENQGQQSKWWLTSGWSLWMPMTILLPAEPRWIGLIAGTLAGLHLYHGLKTVGDFR